MVEKDGEYPLLQWAATEGGIYNEELATLGNLVKVVNADIYKAHTLRYVSERGGRHRAIDLPYAQMGESPWLHCCEKTIRRCVDFWERLSILEIERDRRDERGCRLPDSGRLCWSCVLQQLLGGRRSIAIPPSPLARRCDESDCHSGRARGLTVPGEGLTVPGEGLTVLFTPPQASFGRSLIRAHALARSLFSEFSVILLVDENSEKRQVAFAAVWELAEEARRAIWLAKWPRDPEVKQIFVCSAILGLTVISRNWPIRAALATQRKKPKLPSTYFVAALRNGLVEAEGFPKFPSVEEGRSEISRLLNAVAPIALEVIAECGTEVVAVPAPARDSKPCAADLGEEFKARFVRRREASP